MLAHGRKICPLLSVPGVKNTLFKVDWLHAVDAGVRADFLGNELNYYLTSESNDQPDRGYENTIMGAGISTSFEQYNDVFASLGISATHDDLQTLDSASDSLKKQSGTFNEVSGNYGFSFDKRNRSFMPTDGSIISFSQSLPVYADRSFISNSLSLSRYHSLNEDVVGSGKLFLSAVNGLRGDDVRLSKRKGLSSKRLRGFEKNKIGPVDGDDHIGGNYSAALNFEANLPNILPENKSQHSSAGLNYRAYEKISIRCISKCVFFKFVFLVEMLL